MICNTRADRVKRISLTTLNARNPSFDPTVHAHTVVTNTINTICPRLRYREEYQLLVAAEEEALAEQELEAGLIKEAEKLLDGSLEALFE